MYWGGVIVQQLVKSAKVYDCDGNDVTNSELEQNFREAWDVSAGGTLSTLGARRSAYRTGRNPDRALDDSWQDPSQGICTKGTITIVASAMFLEGGEMPNNFIRDNRDTAAGALPSTILPADQDDPPMAGMASNLVHRELTATWDCCGPDGQGVEAETEVETKVY